MEDLSLVAKSLGETERETAQKMKKNFFLKKRVSKLITATPKRKGIF